jgi:phosphohistidine swiveling domain-containing protein
MTQPAAEHKPIPLPADFPVDFAPGEELLFWQRDRMHFPRPIAPMMHSLVPTEGLTDAFEHFGIPLRMLNRRFNTYHYRAVAPTVRTPEEGASAGEAAAVRMNDAALTIGDDWRDRYLPRVLEHLAWLGGLDLEHASREQLDSYLAEIPARHRDLWRIHFLTVMPLQTATEMFEEFYRETFEPADEFEALSLIEGHDNLTLEASRQLWLLAREAAKHPAVHNAILSSEPREMLQAIGLAEGGTAFLERFRTFLDEFGERGGDQFIEIADPYLKDDPTPLLATLQDYARHPERDWDAERAAQAARRDRRIAEARDRLATYPAPVREQFERLLKAAEEAVVLSEDHGFYIDSKSTYRMRQLLLAAGRRLARDGSLDHPDDVFLLTFDELRATLKDPSADPRPLVTARRAEMAHFAKITPPEAIGTPSPGGQGRRDRFFGQPQEPTGDPKLLKGAAGSPGKVTARARLVRGLSQAGSLQAGEVLVAETTSPVWTPFFATAAAVITETGGILSHCAVVAREYRIPAVVGVEGAMRSIRDGQMIEVDGNAGTVRLLD